MQRSRHIGRSPGIHSGCRSANQEAPRRLLPSCSGRGGTLWRGNPWQRGSSPHASPRPLPSCSPPARASPTPPRASHPPPPPPAAAADGALAADPLWRWHRWGACLASGGADPCLSGEPGIYCFGVCLLNCVAFIIVPRAEGRVGAQSPERPAGPLLASWQ